jgi:hypothetical protein
MSGFNSKRLAALKRFDEQFEFEKTRDWKPVQIYLLVIIVSILAVAVLII